MQAGLGSLVTQMVRCVSCLAAATIQQSKFWPQSKGVTVSDRGYRLQKEKTPQPVNGQRGFLYALVSLQTNLLALCVQMQHGLKVVLHLHRHSCARVYSIGHHTRTLDLNGFIQEVLHLQLYGPVVAWIKAVVDVE